MISFPVNVVLTVAFGLTGLYCVFHLFSTRRLSSATSSRSLTDTQVIDVNHVIMSAAMILMTWVMIGDALLWMQVVLFAVLALSLVPNWARTHALVDRIDIAGHALLDLAMIWMLAAMPLLMAGMDHGGGTGHGDHGAQDTGTSVATTPVWADVVNAGFVVVCVVAGAWWIGRATMCSRRRWHLACYALMAAAMGVMLVAMNA